MSDTPTTSREPNPSGHPEGVTATPPAPDVPTLEAPQQYRPLSLLAVASLVLGIAYALLILIGGLLPFARATPRRFLVLLLLAPILGALGAVLGRQKTTERIVSIAALALVGVVVLMGLGGLIAFSGSAPWEPGLWSWGLLLAALLVSFLALAQIRSAEGALAGQFLARCGLYVTLFFGGFYLLYATANHFAVSTQAQTAADRFLSHVRNDELPEAFALTLKPGARPPASANLRDEIEQGFNTPRSREPGDFSGFCTSFLVQGFRLGGKSKVSVIGVSPEYTPTGYVAQVRYRVENDLGTYEVNLFLQAVDVAGRRDWQVMLGLSRITPPEDSARLREVNLIVRDSEHVAGRWLGGLATRQPETSYLMTLPPEQRWQHGPEFRALVGPAAAGVLEKEFAKGLDDFKANEGRYADFVTLDRQFSGGTLDKAKLKEDVVKFFSHSNRAPVGAEVLRADYPELREEGGEVIVERPIRLTLEPTPEQQNRLIVEGVIVCRGKPGGKLGEALDSYRVVELKLVRAGIAPTAPRGPGG